MKKPIPKQTKQFITDLEIRNFKSIQHLKVKTKRVNVFIGKPNVGKSNILEAVCLLATNWVSKNEKGLKKLMRFDEIYNLFYDDDPLRQVEVLTNIGHAILRFHANAINLADLTIGKGAWVNELVAKTDSINAAIEFFNNIDNNLKNTRNRNPRIFEVEPFYSAIDRDGTWSGGSSHKTIHNFNPIRKYMFGGGEMGTNPFHFFLNPITGDNLYTIIDQNKDLKKEISDIFAEYGLQFVSYKKNRVFEIEKVVNGEVTKYSYKHIADTFQRLFFYMAAIDSNKDAILVLEEPEVHSFPPFTRQLSQRIVESKDNQFFITTHSPYLLQNLVSNLNHKELGLFVTSYKNYETKIRELTAKELKQVSDFGVDLFFNLDKFEHK